jgi:ectoine hydroxylase-related dioxygenase (phytanoyl-CoA dioxygenase family)
MTTPRHYTVVGQVLSQRDVAILIEQCRTLMASVPAETKRHFNDKVRKKFLTDHRMFRTMLAVLDAPAVIDAIRSRARNPYIDHVDLLIKEAHGPITDWHQDGPYWGWDRPASMFTLWVTLGDVDESNGCLRIAGDVDDLLPHRKKVYDEANGFWQYVIDESQADVSRYPVQSIPLESGSAVLFDSFAIHSAFANPSDAPRFAFKIVLGDLSNRTSRGGDRLMALSGLGHQINRRLDYLPAFVSVNAKKMLKPKLRAAIQQVRGALG